SPFNLNLLVGAYNEFDPALPPTQGQTVGVALSQNNGQTWTNTEVPPDQLLFGIDDGPAYDPGTAADKAGNRFVAYAQRSTTGNVSGIFVATYDTNGALVRTRPVYVSGAGFDNLQHQPKLASANSNSSAQNNLYVTWT